MEDRQLRSQRKRSRSKPRSLVCPLHSTRLESASQKHYLYLDQAGQLQVRGMGKHTAMMVLAVHGQVPLRNEWLECFWCADCQQRRWYHVIRDENRSYDLRLAPERLWQQVSGVIDPQGNPTVSQFTREVARATGVHGLKTYRFL
jgi:hypothetical protein